VKNISRQTFWTGATPGFVGSLLLAQLAALRAVATATPERVFVFGRELTWGCLFQRIFGVPCPICGMTRGVLLTLQGHVSDALRLNPAAPALTLGVVLFALAMIFVALYQHAHDLHRVGRLHARIRLAARAYAGMLLAIMCAHWIVEVLVN
jgi:disulfide bond formation protein DsbB